MPVLQDVCSIPVFLSSLVLFFVFPHCLHSKCTVVVLSFVCLIIDYIIPFVFNIVSPLPRVSG